MKTTQFTRKNKIWIHVLASVLLTQLVASTAMAQDDKSETEHGERKVLYWVAPMDPNYRRDKPGKSPMGMDLIPVYADEVGDGTSISIDPQMVQNLGIRTALAERGRLWQAVRAPGFITIDRNRVRDVEVRFPGWVQETTVQETGEQVKAGQLLFSVYSPEVNSAQRDYLQILRSGKKPLIAAARERLRALGLSESLIHRLDKSRQIIENIPVVAPIDGYVAMANVRQGDYIKPGKAVMRLETLNKVWLMLQAPERKAALIKAGLPVDYQLQAEGAQPEEGRIDYVYPQLDDKTRTVMARLTIENTDNSLKPGLLARATIYAGPKDGIIYVPSEAVIRLGDENRVIVALGEGKFAARDVGLGIESGRYTEITWGLEEGDEVVVSGQFLLDSEASFKASMMRAGGDEAQENGDASTNDGQE